MCKEKNGVLNINMEDEVIRAMTVVKDGTITWPPPKPKVTAIVTEQPVHAATKAKIIEEISESKEKKSKGWRVAGFMLLCGLILGALGMVAPPDFMGHFTVFVLACFVGYQVVWNVSPALHTPLMSVTNAISGIIIIGAILQLAGDDYGSAKRIIVILAGIAVLISTVNIAGGFLVTHRMLKMFRK
jgi:NAD(P) transhydrogenase subunit alpha